MCLKKSEQKCGNSYLFAAFFPYNGSEGREDQLNNLCISIRGRGGSSVEKHLEFQDIVQGSNQYFPGK